ncbi:MAG: hypothetical protein A3G87_02735 [Omnitrophica bacterium RIFCSPLOWO2_12_FULL_50_11]|nr:MAG: hypothetical protein A3G87_02735 [Omnitrophica bacterium RIFCSPLOWO2_12_FULL_50_11]
MDVTLSGKQILVTGGTSALGRIFVRRALEEGAAVFFTYHQNTHEASCLAQLGAKGFQVDLAKRAEIDQLKKQIQSYTRALDAIVQNAATVRDHTIQNLTESEWDEVLGVDLDSVYYLIKRFLSFLFKKPGSRILNVVSRAGLQGGFGIANYAAAKGGLIALTKSLAREIGKKQVLVNALNPGFMKSHMTQRIPEQAFRQNIEESVLGTISDPEAVADFMIYLLSDRFRGVSGQIFHFDSRGTN